MSSLWQATIYYIGQEVDRISIFNFNEIILESILPYNSHTVKVSILGFPINWRNRRSRLLPYFLINHFKTHLITVPSQHSALIDACFYSVTHLFKNNNYTSIVEPIVFLLYYLINFTFYDLIGFISTNHTI